MLFPWQVLMNHSGLVPGLALLPAGYLAYGVALLVGTVALKWAVIFRYRRGRVRIWTLAWYEREGERVREREEKRRKSEREKRK